MKRLSFKLIYPLLIVLIITTLFICLGKRVDLLPIIYLEIIFFYVLSFLFFSHKAGTFLWTIYCLILGCQVASIYSSGSFIIPLTLTNAREFSALGYYGMVKIIAIMVLCVLSALTIFFFKTKTINLNKIYGICFIIVFGFSISVFKLPLNYLFCTLVSYYKQITYQPEYNYPKFSKKFLKSSIWNEDRSKKLSWHNKNVIVIFTEGMSSDIIDDNNNLGLGLTPNLDRLLRESISFKNYYNHTAATFRGLRGQLTSAYQYKDGINVNNDGFAQITPDAVSSNYRGRLISVPEILNDNGYDTIFLTSTEKNSTLNAMLKSMSFKHVYGMGDFTGYQDDRMSDKQTFAALKQLLDSRKNNNTPFFIGVYPSGTHHGRDSSDLKYKNSSNTYYNKFYNYDMQLGSFMQYFDRSQFSKNTTIIITSDHSTFATPEFKKSFGINATFFVDKIPLIIYNSHNKPISYDAEGKNSLALAPTILQMLNINNHFNYFLGCSLFDDDCLSMFSKKSAIGDDFYETFPAAYPDYKVKSISSEKTINEFYKIGG